MPVSLRAVNEPIGDFLKATLTTALIRGDMNSVAVGCQRGGRVAGGGRGEGNKGVDVVGLPAINSLSTPGALTTLRPLVRREAKFL